MLPRSCSLLLTILFLLPLGISAQEVNNKYEIEASFNADTEELSGSVRITLGSGYTDDLVFVTAALDGQSSVKIVKAQVDGQVVNAMPSGGQYAIERGQGKILSLDFAVRTVSQQEGIYYFPTPGGVEKFSWFPKLVNDQQIENYSVHLNLIGTGSMAFPQGFAVDRTMAASGKYQIQGASRNGFSFIYSPIFMEKRVLVAGCNLGLFMREGSETWQMKALNYLSEVYSYYSEKIPGFSFSQLDVVLTGIEHASANNFPGILMMKDEMETMVDEFGAVFAANYVRWNSSLALSMFFWDRKINQGDDIPWLSRGVSLYYAEKYANQALLGGPAFDNIRQFYLNAASSRTNTTLDQTISQAENSGIDYENVLAQSKGLWVTKMLAQKLGSTSFKAFLRRVIEERGKPLSNARILALAQEESGKDLRDFGESWIQGNAILDYGVKSIAYKNQKAEVILENKSTARQPAVVLVSYEDGSQDNREIVFTSQEFVMNLAGGKRVARVRVDPDSKLPDVNRSNNMVSKLGSRRIKQLYAIDSYFEIGDVSLISQPEKSMQGRSADVSLSLMNKLEEKAYLAVHFTLRFPGGRNRGVTKMLLELAPGEEKVVNVPMNFPMRGYGLAYLTADYFKISGEKEFSKLSKNSKPALRSFYVFNITQ